MEYFLGIVPFLSALSTHFHHIVSQHLPGFWAHDAVEVKTWVFSRLVQSTFSCDKNKSNLQMGNEVSQQGMHKISRGRLSSIKTIHFISHPLYVFSITSIKANQELSTCSGPHWVKTPVLWRKNFPISHFLGLSSIFHGPLNVFKITTKAS